MSLMQVWRIGMAAGLCCWGTQTVFAQRELTNIPTPNPEAELKAFQLAEGFEINLFAADPQIHKPIQFNFDAEGRLWIAASQTYPQIRPGEVANDKILILEDTDGDGVSDKTTVFAEGLLIPTGVVPGDGGAYVANSTELLHLADTDGDGKADRRRVVLTGFGTEDTHHIIHTFRWSPAGRLNFSQSIYIHSHVETPFGVRRLNAGGIWEYRRDRGELDVFARGWVNTWGHQFDRWGQSFATDGAGSEGIYHVIPGAAYATAYGADRILPGMNPGSPKYCGLDIIENPHFPESWQGQVITSDFRGHRVCAFRVEDRGSQYVSIQQPDLVKSSHTAFRPIDTLQGPDGALYIADWYNPIIQHGEVDFHDPRRDRVHGRIWRVTAKGRPLTARLKVARDDVDGWLAALSSSHALDRSRARQRLKELGPKVVEPKLWREGLSEHEELERLWVAMALREGAISRNEAVIERLAQSSEGRVRAAVVRAMGDDFRLRRSDPLLLQWAVEDAHPRVRLEAICLLRWCEQPAALGVALDVLHQPLDEGMEYALTDTVRTLWPLTDAAERQGLTAAGLIFLADAIPQGAATAELVQALAAGRFAAEQELAGWSAVARSGSPELLAKALDRAVELAPTRTADAVALLEALARATETRKAQPAAGQSAVLAMVTASDGALRAAAIRCLAAWQVDGAQPALQALVTANETAGDVRRLAVQALSNLGGGAAWLRTLAGDSKASEPARAEAIAARWNVEREAYRPLVREAWAGWSQAEARQAVWQAVLQQKDGAEQAVALLAELKLAENVAREGLRLAAANGQQSPLLTAAIRAAGGLPETPRPWTSDEVAQLIATVRAQGNPAHGEAVYRRADLNCMKCHALSGAGGKVGPELSSIGASAQPDYIVDSLLEPTKQVKEGYHSVVVTTNAGKVLTGIKLRQTDEALYLRLSDNQEVAVASNDIDEQVPGLSLMPAGLTEKLSDGDFRDLVAYLMSLGKQPEYSAGVSRVARHWEVLEPTKESSTRLSRTSDSQLVADDTGLQWQPLYATAAGAIPVGEMLTFTQDIKILQLKREISFVRSRFEVISAGRTTLRLREPETLKVWIDGVPRDAVETLELSLKPGVHTLTLQVDRAKRRSPVRAELVDVSGDAQGQWVRP